MTINLKKEERVIKIKINPTVYGDMNLIRRIHMSMEMEKEGVESVEIDGQMNIKKEEEPGKLIPISGETQAFAPLDHRQLIGFVKQMIQAKALPRHLKTVPEVLSAWNYAAQLRLPPQPSLRNIAVIEGTPSLFGDLPLALVQRHDEFVYYEEFTIDSEYKKICFENKNLDAKIFGGVVKLQRLGMKEPHSFSFTMADAERAGLLRRAKNGMPWEAYPQVMIVRRARIIAIRALFADALSGAAIAEDFGYAPDLRDVNPNPNDNSKANILNERFKEQTK